MFRMAIEDGAVSLNPVRDSSTRISVDWMLATGCRIGEALAPRHGPNADGAPLLDLDANTWEVNATVVRVPR